MKQGISLDEQDSNGNTPLILAVQNQDVQKVKELIEKGCDVNITTKIGQSAIWDAFEYNNLEMIQLLIDAGADINILD